MGIKYENLDDKELFYLLAEKKSVSEKAFAELYNRYSSRVYAYCRRFLGNKDEAQDAFQEAFAKFYASAKDDREMTNVPGFLMRITRNLCVNTLRKEKDTVSYEDYMGVVRNENRQEKNELLNLIKMALDLLPAEYREVFILREYDGMSYQEIADVVGESLSTIKVRIHRSKKKVREILAPYLADLKKHS